MPYVERNPQGEITCLHREMQPGAVYVAATDPELQRFLARAEVGLSRAASAEGEATLRALQDVVDLLAVRNLLRVTDLPVDTQQLLFARRARPASALAPAGSSAPRRRSLLLYDPALASSGLGPLDSGVVPTQPLDELGLLPSTSASLPAGLPVGLRLPGHDDLI